METITLLTLLFFFLFVSSLLLFSVLLLFYVLSLFSPSLSRLSSFSLLFPLPPSLVLSPSRSIDYKSNDVSSSDAPCSSSFNSVDPQHYDKQTIFIRAVAGGGKTEQKGTEKQGCTSSGANAIA